MIDRSNSKASKNDVEILLTEISTNSNQFKYNKINHSRCVSGSGGASFFAK